MLKELFIERGYCSINKHDETLCGDSYTIIKNDNTMTITLSDGLGSGVKANILSTLTSKILSTLSARKLPIDQCIYTMAKTLPICKERKLAYATFSLLQIEDDKLYIAQFDNPKVIILRDGKHFKYPSARIFIEEKEIYESTLELQKGDMIILFTDGVTNAGLGKTTHHGWKEADIIKYLEMWYTPELSPQRLAADLLNASMALNFDSPEDDTTILTFKVKERKALNIMIGPPSSKSEDEKIFRLFFSKGGKYVVCGGTTAKAVSKYLNKPVKTIPSLHEDDDIPAKSHIDGIDLITEGIITLKRVVELSHEYVKDSIIASQIKDKEDGASLLAKMLFEEATDINIFFGQAINEDNNLDGVEIDFNTKTKLIGQLEDNLKKLNKHVRISKC